MSDNGGQRPNEAQAPAYVEIVIRFVPQTAEFNIEGPIDKPVLFLGMLEMAKQSMRINVRDMTPGRPLVEVPGDAATLGNILKQRQ